MWKELLLKKVNLCSPKCLDVRWRYNLMGEKNDWATENKKEAPYWRDGMTPKE